MMDNLEEIKNFAEELLQRVGLHIQKSINSRKIIKESFSTNVTTDIDEYVERLIRLEIKKRFPNHACVGEELGGTIDDNKPTWIIDPIDGTREFIHNVPLYCTTLSLQYKKEILVGVVFQPSTQDLFSAARGYGSYRNGKQIYCSSCEDLKKSFLVMKFNDNNGEQSFSKVKNLIKRAYRVSCFRNQNLSLCWVATGGYDGYINLQGYKKWWDVAPGTLIVREAGGVVKDENGKDLNSITLPNKPYWAGSLLGDQLLTILQDIQL